MVAGQQQDSPALKVLDDSGARDLHVRSAIGLDSNREARIARKAAAGRRISHCPGDRVPVEAQLDVVCSKNDTWIRAGQAQRDRAGNVAHQLAILGDHYCHRNVPAQICGLGGPGEYKQRDEKNYQDCWRNVAFHDFPPTCGGRDSSQTWCTRTVLGQNSISQPSTTRVLESATSAIALQDGSGQGIATERSVNGSPVQKSLARARITFQSLATSKLNDSGYAARRT